MNTLEKISHLRGLKGTNAKIAFLQENVGDYGLKQILSTTYEPTIAFYFTPDKKAWVGVVDDANVVDLIAEMRHVLGERVKTGAAAKAYYQELLSRTNADGRRLIDAVLNRDIKAGVAEGSINKVWPGLITAIPYMRCTLPAVAKVKEWQWGSEDFYAYSQIKADGMYANVTVEAGRVTITSRNGSVFLNGDWMAKIGGDAKAVATSLTGDVTPSIQFHGELLVKKDGVVMPRKDGNGVMNSILQSGVMPAGAYEVVFAVWDAIPLAFAVAGGRYSMPYKHRFDPLVKACEKLVGSVSMYCLETVIVKTWAEAVAHFVDATSRGEEGTILKRWDAQWMDGDSREQVKMKISFSVDLVITGFNAGNPNGKHAATFGSIQGATRQVDGETPLVVGVSGMKDEVRREIHSRRDDYIGVVMTVESNAVIQNREGNYSLFLPRLIEVRRDKTVPDSLAEVIEQFDAAMAGKALGEAMNPWQPMRAAIDLKHMGKLAEELGECSAAASRCMIQGIDEREPVTGKLNREWLEDELADVEANSILVTAHFGLNRERIAARAAAKASRLKIWHGMPAVDGET